MKFRRSRLSILFIASCLAVALTILPAQGQSESVQVATFNTFLPSALFRCGSVATPIEIADCLAQKDPTPEWAHAIADLVLSDPERFDILALNEVWTDETRGILASRLSGAFPTVVAKLDADLIQLRHQSLIEALSALPTSLVAALHDGVPLAKINGEDSGLMLFVSPRFEVLPLPDTTFRWGDEAQETLEASTGEVGFVLFKSCVGIDCLSAKGAGLLRLRERFTRRIYNVVFTHLQADDLEKGVFHPGARKGQLEEIARMVETTIGPVDSLGQERLLVMGDLNIPVLRPQGQSEWNELFGTGGSRYTDSFHDTWAATTSPADRGVTNKVDVDRLDYIVAGGQPYESGGVEGPICVQHLTIPEDFAVSTSDHKLVHADLNAGAPFCYPQMAHRVDLEVENVNGRPQIETVISNNALISFPGSMQWFHVRRDGPGTFSISVDSPQLRMDVYTPDNLTTPVSRYNRTTRTETDGRRRYFVDTFVLPEEFYIRISGRQRSFTGAYALRVQQHTCATRQEACLLRPGDQPQTALLTRNGNAGGIQNEAWFRFVAVGQSDSGAVQTITLTADGLADPRLGVELVDLAETSGAPPPAETRSGSRHAFTGLMGDSSSGYVVVSQPAPGPTDAPVSVQMESDLKVLTLFNLVCEDETNPELGSDEIFTILALDWVRRRLPSSGYSEFDCDNPRHARDWSWGSAARFYTRSASIRLIEDDDLSPNDASSLRDFPLPAPGPHGTRAWHRWNFDGGDYRLEYRTVWQQNLPVE